MIKLIFPSLSLFPPLYEAVKNLVPGCPTSFRLKLALAEADVRPHCAVYGIIRGSGGSL